MSVSRRRITGHVETPQLEDRGTHDPLPDLGNKGSEEPEKGEGQLREQRGGRDSDRVEALCRQATERALGDRLHFMERLIDVIPSPVFYKDRDAIYRGCNTAFERYTGRSKRKIIGKTVYDVAPKELADVYHRMDQELLSHPGVQTYESSIKHKDGTWHDVIFNKATYTDPDGDVAGLIGIVTDITDRKRAELALRESEERYRISIEHSNDGVAIVRGDQHIYVNRRFLDMFGYDEPEELLGKRVFITVHPEDRERVIDINRDRQSGKVAPARYEFKGIRKNGSLMYVEVSATKILYQGEPATLAYLRDITERRQTEEELRHAQKMQAIGTLVGGIAHDFNNVLAAMIGFSELVLKDLEDGSVAKRRLNSVLKAGMRGRDLARQILTFSRKTKHKKSPVHLTPLVKETAKMLRATVPSTIRIELAIATESDEIVADPSQIQQVLMNLATNAVHAMHEKGGTLDISIANVRAEADRPLLQPDMAPGNYVMLSVRDSGYGMDREVKERMFEPFFTTKPVDEGTGLGLSVVYGIVNEHRGTISVSSEPGKGSTFTIFLPQAERPTAASRTERSTSPLRGNERVLFVDDEELLVEMNRDMLEGLGYRVSATTDSRDALTRFSESPADFDLVIADQTMPHITGLDLARKIMHIRPDMPIILCTGYSEALSTEEAKALGVKELVVKPLMEQELAEAVRRALEPREDPEDRKGR